MLASPPPCHREATLADGTQHRCEKNVSHFDRQHRCYCGVEFDTP